MIANELFGEQRGLESICRLKLLTNHHWIKVILLLDAIVRFELINANMRLELCGKRFVVVTFSANHSLTREVTFALRRKWNVHVIVAAAEFTGPFDFYFEDCS